MTRARNLANLGNKNAITADIGLFNIGIGSTQPTNYKLEVVGGNAYVGGGVTITGNLSVGGTVTYEDVTNVDAVGIVTAAKGFRATDGGIVVTAGVSTFPVVAVSAGTTTKDLKVTGVSTFVGAATFGDNVYVTDSSIHIVDSIVHYGDTDTNIGFPAVDTFTIDTGGSERARVTSTGNLLVGAIAVEDWDGSRDHRIQVTGNTYQTAGISILDTQNDDNPGELLLGKSRGTGNTIVGSADDVGQIRFAANDGAGFHSVAWIRSSMDGTPGSDDLPSNLRFGTSADGGTTVSERLRITSGGQVIIGATSVSPANSYSNNLVVSEASGDCGISIHGNNSNSNYASLYFGDAGSGQRCWIETQLGSGGNLTIGGGGVTRFYNNGAERVRIDSSGRLLIGTTDIDSVSDGEVPKLISKGTDSTAGAAFVRHSSDTGGCGIYLAKSRNATIGSNTIVQSGDELGRITFSGDDGTNLNTQGAQIAAHVDGTPGENDMPGRLQFYTTADGAANVTERMRITAKGDIGINTTGVSYSDHIYLAIRGNSTSRGGVVHVGNSNQSVTGQFSVYDDKVWVHSGTSHPVVFGAGGASQHVTLATTGKLGIGVASPTRQLTIQSNGGQLAINDTDNTQGEMFVNGGDFSVYCRGNSNLGDGSTGGRFTVHTHPASGSITERLRIDSDGKIGVNQTPENGGGLVQLRNNMGYQSQTTNLEEAGSMALLRLRMSNDSSKSLFFGGLDESATPYLQVGNKSTNGPNAVYPLMLQPYGGAVGIGTETVPAGNEVGLLDIYHTSDNDINNPHIRLHGPANNDARIEFGVASNTGEGAYIMYNDSDEGLYIGARMAAYSEINFCTGMNDGSPTDNVRLSINSTGVTDAKRTLMVSGNASAGTSGYIVMNGYDTSIAAGASKTFTFSGMTTGWADVDIGGYAASGQAATSYAFKCGGYMTQTYTWWVTVLANQTRNTTISATQNASDYAVTITNNATTQTQYFKIGTRSSVVAFTCAFS